MFQLMQHMPPSEIGNIELFINVINQKNMEMFYATYYVCDVAAMTTNSKQNQKLK